MSNIVNLFPENSHGTIRDLLTRAQQLLESGQIQPDDKAIFMFGVNGTHKIDFIQKGLDTMGIVGMLEIAKIQIIDEQTKAKL